MTDSYVVPDSSIQMTSGDGLLTMPVVEHFVSINGEGQQAGKLAAFVRFAGCNLRCSYCDTQWALEPAASHEMMSVDDLVSFIREAGVTCVTLTGGEPLLQPHMKKLVRALLTLPPDSVAPQGRWIEIETNGSRSLQELARVRASMLKYAPGKKRTASSQVESEAPGGKRNNLAGYNQLSFTMDYKTPSSGMEAYMNTDNIALLEPCDTVKFVVGTTEDLEAMAHVVDQYDLTARCAVYVSPVFGQIDPADIVAFMEYQGLSRVRLQLQLHKIIWPHCERGV